MSTSFVMEQWKLDHSSKSHKKNNSEMKHVRNTRIAEESNVTPV